MATFIRQRERIRMERYMLGFTWIKDPGAGFSFECDKDGNLEHLDNPAAVENYEYCLAHPDEIRANGIEDWSYHYTQDAAIRCPCGREVDLHGATNACECGRDYDMGGNLLAPRSQWGEETGESVSDILNIGPDADGIWHDEY